MKQYRINLKDGRIIGPLGLEQVVHLYKIHSIGNEDNIQVFPTGDWKKWSDYPELLQGLNQLQKDELEFEYGHSNAFPKQTPSSLNRIAEHPRIHRQQPLHSQEKDSIYYQNQYDQEAQLLERLRSKLSAHDFLLLRELLVPKQNLTDKIFNQQVLLTLFKTIVFFGMAAIITYFEFQYLIQFSF